MLPTPNRRYRTVRRSADLFRSFLVEQSDPERFYTDLAKDTITLITRHEPLDDRLVLDIGAGSEQFGREFAARGARYVAIDLERESFPAGSSAAGVVGRGEQIPVADGSVDIVMANNLMEHVRAPGVVGDEMLRVVRPGGLVFISYTAWASPWGGHETSPWHWLGGHYAAKRYERKHGHPPKNVFGTSMHPTTVAGGLRWARRQPEAWLIEAAPRYHPEWADGVLSLPGFREVVTWNLMMVLRRA
jgi:SAM-dependent methyltransferase